MSFHQINVYYECILFFCCMYCIISSDLDSLSYYYYVFSSQYKGVLLSWKSTYRNYSWVVSTPSITLLRRLLSFLKHVIVA